MAELRNIWQSSRDEEQMKDMIKMSKEMIFKTAEDIKRLGNDFASDLGKKCGKQLKDRVKTIVDLDHQLGDEFEAYRRATEQIINAFDALRANEDYAENTVGSFSANWPDEDGEVDDEEGSGGSGDDEDDEGDSISRPAGPRARRSTSKRMSKQKGKKKAPDAGNKIISGKVDLFQENLNSIKAARKRRKSDGTMKSLKALLDSQAPRAAAGGGGSEEEDLVASDGEFQIPIDPYTNKEVEKPVKNTKCGHIYDREGIMAYIHSKTRPRCPAIGCANRLLTVEDLVDDEETRIKIQRLMALRSDSDSSD